MTRIALLSALAAATMACAGPSQASVASALAAAQYASAEAPGFGCEIYRARTLHGLRLEASAIGFENALEPLEYEFIVTKRGAGGASDIVQGGEVTEAELGVVELSLEPGDRFEATLVLSDSQGEVCAAEASS